jgi:signal transduction histidine kinase
MDQGRGSAPEDGDPVAPRGADVPPEDNVHLEASALALLDAFAAISSDLDTGSVLTRLVSSACELTGAQYGALGVIGHDGRLADFVTHGMDQAAVDAIGELPVGQGLLDVRLERFATMRLEDLSDHPASVGFPSQHPEMKTLLRVPVSVRGTAFGQLYLTERQDGRPFTRYDELLVQALTSVAGFVIENARAYGVSERRRRWLELFGDLTELLMPPITLTDALERIAAAARDASESRSASVVQVPAKGVPFAAATSGEPFELTEQEQDRFNRTVRAVVEQGEVVDLVLGEDRVARMAPLRAHLALPGVLVISHQHRGRPHELEERELLSSFADQAALALDRTQALEDREQMAVVSDRDRIARDLHDVVIQRLFATGLHMQSIRSAAPNDELRARIDQSVKDLDQTIRDIRGTIFELQTRPQNSLRTEVRDAVREFLPDLGFAPSVEMTGPVDTSVEQQVQQQLVSVLREALSNVGRHAEATKVSVELQVTPTHLRLRISDNGKGLPEDRTEYGLRNARRRAVLLGGALDLWPNEPTGTVFVWSVPLPDADGTVREK